MGDRALNGIRHPLLKISDLRVEFGATAVLHDLSFEIAAGEVLGVVGESGAGKSITGAAVIGLMTPPGRITGGSIHLQGERIDTLPEPALRRVRGAKIGCIFQDPSSSLDPLFSVGDQLAETIRVHKGGSYGAAIARATALLRQVGIPAPERRLQDYPHQFSGGMRQRVVIALALCADPALIIADEPTTALDVSVQAQVIALLRTICRGTGAGMMLITHDMGVIAELADRVAVMYAGRIVEMGAAQAVLRHPLHPYTVGLMRSIPRIGQVGALRQIPGAMPRPGRLPAGCAFHPRCDRSFDRCLAERPALLRTGAQQAACWLQDAPVAG